MKTRLLVIALSACIPGAADAWGVVGHRVIGELGEAQLSPAARAQVQALLAGEPEPSLAAVSTWADQVREQGDAYRWSVPLHWVNFERGACQYDPDLLCRDGRCVVGAIEKYTAELAETSLPLAQRREALKWVVHFVGDVHQPLHAGFGFDRGGNDFQINFQRTGWNLHSVWDSLILESTKLDWQGYRQRIAETTFSDEAAARARELSPRRWAEESCEIVHREDFYPPRHKITRAYLDAHRPLADERLKLAAARLAGVLNEALGER